MEMNPAGTGQASRRDLCLLSLDGGGIRGISGLFILEEIMHRIKRLKKLDHEPLPAEYFDLMGGTSTGGLIAILLGRLRFSVPEAIEVYRTLAKDIFSKRKMLGKDGAFKASSLERAIKKVLVGKLGEGKAEEKMFEVGEEGVCKTFVCAIPTRNIQRNPRLFRTWSADKNPGYNCAIWEACRATTAASTFFKPILIGQPGLQEEFVDAALGCNNPVTQVVREATQEFQKREIGCVLSIGTGKQGITAIRSSRFDIRGGISRIKAWKRITTDAEHESREMQERFKDRPGSYFRFNVERGLEGIALSEWDKMSDVKTHTIAYLDSEDVSQEVDRVVMVLLRQSRKYGLGGNNAGPPHLHDAPTYCYYPAISRPQPLRFSPRSETFNEIENTPRSERDTGPEVAVFQSIARRETLYSSEESRR